MSSRRRKKPLPPWLSGVTVTKSGVEDILESDIDLTVTQKKQKLEQQTDEHGTNESKDCGNSDKSGTNKCKEIESQQNEIKFNKGNEVKNKTRDKSVAVEDEPVSVERLVEFSYPEYTFSGSIIYCHHKDDCSILCEEIMTTLPTDTDVFVRFDTEWPITYQKGKQPPTALIQLCLDINKCYLFHISCMPKLPPMLKQLIQKKNVKKVGLNVEYDLWKLEMDFDINAKDVIQNSTVELRTLANQKLRSAENWSLEGLTKNVLRLRISKDPKIRTCDWSQYPLPEQQQRYAATDAIVSLMLYQRLAKM